jgi:hypothetical protein
MPFFLSRIRTLVSYEQHLYVHTRILVANIIHTVQKCPDCPVLHFNAEKPEKLNIPKNGMSQTSVVDPDPYQIER